MNADDERFLKTAKEVLVNFDEKFRSIYRTIKDTVLSARLADFEIASAREEEPEEK